MVNSFYTIEDAKNRALKHWRHTCSGVCGDALQKIKTAIEALPEDPTVAQVEEATGRRVSNFCDTCDKGYSEAIEVVEIYSAHKGLMCLCEDCVDNALAAFRDNAAHVL